MTILAAIGEHRNSTDIISTAADLATAFNDSLVVLHVVPEEEFDAHKKSIESVTDFRDFSLSQEKDSAARFAYEITKRTLGEVDHQMIQTRGRIGDPTEEILAEADELDPRYLVIGGRHRSPVGKAIFGSTTQKILLNADCPVVTSIVD
ncbi:MULTISPECIES: universal stress protein [Haloferacaceae]|uniref:Universal stress protein n=1 Tax=Halorubrum glutamatedens TaxID=2707018 RepID=A0ABD5QNA0_9EURY|nr:universal stress protein [Halobellus captivus]